MFKINRKVFYDDTDGGGVVYHANYLKYLDHARSEYLAHYGFELKTLVKEFGVLFAVVDVEICYRLPARLSDQLEISADLKKITSARFRFHQTVNRFDPDREELLCLTEGHITLACLDAVEFKPCPIPRMIKERLSRDV